MSTYYKATDKEFTEVADAIREVLGIEDKLTWNIDYIDKILSFSSATEELRKKIEELKEQIKVLEQQIETLEGEKTALQETINTLNEQVAEMEALIEEKDEIITDLQEQIEELSKSFEIVTITSSKITSFTKLKDTLQALEKGKTGLVMYVAKAVYQTANSIICFPLVDGKFDAAAYCYRNDPSQGLDFYALNYDDYRTFEIPAYSKMLRVVLEYAVQ